jgi:formylglycine-generating enzyme required for sulfatase activity
MILKLDFRKSILFVMVLFMPLLSAQLAMPQQTEPISKEKLITALGRLHRNDSQAEIVKTVGKLGVDFELTANAKAELRRAGARPELIAAVRDSFRGGAKNSAKSNSDLSNMPRTRTNQAGIEFVLIRPGNFPRGSTNGEADEKPVRQVAINYSFYMGKYEVTQGQWQAVMGMTLRQQRDKANPSWNLAGEGDDYPIYYVNWKEAKSFVQRLNALNDGYTYRLPTEAEWEYACRAGTTGDYSGDLDSVAWYGNNSGNGYIDADNIWQIENSRNNYTTRMLNNGNRTHAARTKVANGFGLHDMHGNVWEWCEDWYHPDYEGAPINGSGWLTGGDQKYRVLRGGSWYEGALGVRSANRYKYAPDSCDSNVGFRVVAVARIK